MNPTRITLSGRTFSIIDGRANPPSRGEYVAYGGKFFPVNSKSGYPLSVVADIAAGQNNKVVIIPGDGVFAFLSGTGRVVFTEGRLDEKSPQDLELFYKSLLRLTLLSDHKEVVVVGEVPSLGAIPIERVSLESLPLPTVIKPTRTWLMLGMFAALCLSAAFVSSRITSESAKKASVIAAEKAKVETELDAAMAEIKAARAKLAPTAGAPASAPSSTDPLPSPTGSFVGQLREGKTPPTNLIRVTDGRFQY